MGLDFGVAAVLEGKAARLQAGGGIRKGNPHDVGGVLAVCVLRGHWLVVFDLFLVGDDLVALHCLLTL